MRANVFLVAVGSVAAILLTSIAPGSTAAPISFSATFTMVQGNEWWQQAQVTPSGDTLSKVDLRLNAGTWQPLTLQSWGVREYAGNYHAVQGTIIQLRATSASGATALSPCYQWIPAKGADAVQVACAPPPPPPPPPPPTSSWSNDTFAVVSGQVWDMATGDTDGDGRGGLYVATDVALFQTKQGPTSAVSGLDRWDAVTLGDLDHNGRAEIYAARYNSQNATYDVHQFTRTGPSSWTDRIMFVQTSLISSLSVGDVDRDGTMDLYAIGDTAGFQAAAWQLHYTATGFFPATQIMALANPSSSTQADSFWIGDADGTGQAALAVMVSDNSGAGHVFLVQYTTTWITVDVGATGDYAGAIVAGDVDGDGHGEIAATGSTSLSIFKLQAGTWVHSTALALSHAGDLFLGDADNNGIQELYVVDGQNVDIARKATSGWSATTIGTLPHVGERLIVGDGDQDALREAFAASGDAPSTQQTFTITRLQTASASTSATFSAVRGNEWWIQATVSGNGATLAAVDVRLNQAAWQPLAKQSWGGYAASIHVTQGTTVQLRATTTDGRTALSDCYSWIPASNTDAAKMSCPSQPPPSQFQATFSAVKGSDYWMEAVITANQPVQVVFVYFNGCQGQPAQMDYHADWGKWALGTHIPAGTKVVIEAIGNSGNQFSGGYLWPNATPTSGC